MKVINIFIRLVSFFRYNRQFKFEEKDGYGVVHGRYGYYDKSGKMKIVNYTAHPKHGFAAEGEFGKYP
jgi:hypothetical protein